MPIDRKGYRAAKKEYKSVVRDNKQISRDNKKAMSDAAKSRKKNSKAQAKSVKKWEKSGGVGPQPRFGVKYSSPGLMGYFYEGDKPKRSDYKSSKPQRATGSNASKMRMAKVIGQLNSAKMFMNTVSGKKRK